MQQLSMQDEHDVQWLVAKGNDEEATRLVYELVNLSPSQKQERVQVLLRLGERYTILGLLQEDGPHETHSVEALVKRRVQTRCFFPPHERDELALQWYQEAINNYSSSLDEDVFECTSQERYTLHRRLVHIHRSDAR